MAATTIYPTGRVYKVTNPIDDLVYVGSTTQTLAQRMGQHRESAKRGKHELVYVHMRALGIPKFDIFLLEQTGPTTREALRALENKYICQLDTVKHGLNAKYESVFCSHDRMRSKCKDCGGSEICEHSRYKYQCRDCKGSQICQHDRVRHQCRDCGGSMFCEHDVQRHTCKLCNPCRYCGEADTGRHRSSKVHIRNFIMF